MRRECRNRFPCHQLQRKPRVSDPDMHDGTCVTHVPWCMSRSLTLGGGENVPGIPGACATCNFTYLARDPSHYAIMVLVACTDDGQTTHRRQDIFRHRFWPTRTPRASLVEMHVTQLLYKLTRRGFCFFNTLRPRQNGCHFTDDIFKCIFLEWKCMNFD